MQAFAAKNGVDLAKSYFYADGDEDVALMYLVGNPRPTNPAGKLEAVAAKRGWPVLGSPAAAAAVPVSQLRTVAGIASLVPAAAGAIGLGLLTRNRRTGVNFFTSTWSRLLMTSIGIDLNVIGEENLTAKRPAVFLFNHRNQADPFIAGRLVSDNFTSVGKKELEKDPLMGTIGKMMDAAFIDRDDPKAAVESLHKMEELARKGLSILIAPEGTRLDTTEVGSSRRDPSGSRWRPGSRSCRSSSATRRSSPSATRARSTPARVDVAVFPPIPVDDWTPRTSANASRRSVSSTSTRSRTGPRVTLPSAPLTSGTQSPAKKAPAKKAAAKKAPAKKAPAKKVPAKKAAKKFRQEGARQEGCRQANPAKKGRP